MNDAYLGKALWRKSLTLDDMPGAPFQAVARAPQVLAPKGYVRLSRPGIIRLSDRRAHYVDALDDPQLGTPAVCGATPPIGQEWSGWRTESDRDDLNQVKTCRNCARWAERQEQP